MNYCGDRLKFRPNGYTGGMEIVALAILLAIILGVVGLWSGVKLLLVAALAVFILGFFFGGPRRR